MNALFVLLLLQSFGKIIVHTLNEDNYEKMISSSDIPWLVLFKGNRILDKEMETAMHKLSELVRNDDVFKIGIVDCVKNQDLCSKGFEMNETPWLVYFVNGNYFFNG